MIEFCFLVPWYLFLFVGAFDFGFYAYSLIATSNAARVSSYFCNQSASYCTVGYVSGSINGTNNFNSMCTNYVIGQLKYMPNIGTTVTTCAASPLTVTATYPATPSTGCPDGNACITLSVVYVTPQLIPIPGIFPGQLTITKALTMRLKT